MMKIEIGGEGERRPLSNAERAHRAKLNANKRAWETIKVVHRFNLNDREFRILERPNGDLEAQELRYVQDEPGRRAEHLEWKPWVERKRGKERPR